MVQVPGIRNCAVVPVTEHTLGVEELRLPASWKLR
jgi:hypothetical protein